MQPRSSVCPSQSSSIWLSQRSSRGWATDKQTSAPTEQALDADATAMQIGQLLHQRQPQTRAFELAIQIAIHLHERLEQALQVCWCNANARIDDGKFDAILFGLCMHLSHEARSEAVAYGALAWSVVRMLAR